MNGTTSTGPGGQISAVSQKSDRRARFLLAILWLSAAISLPAAVMRQMPISELAEKSDVIVHGTVLGQCCHRDPDGGIYTSVKVRVAEVWKGALQTNVLTVVHGGGTVDGVRLEVSGQADYAAGEEVVLFLAINPSGEPVTLGLGQGKFHVWGQGAAKFACNPFLGTPESGGGESATASSAPLPLQELKRQVEGGAS
jgi:hypothetical protein